MGCKVYAISRSQEKEAEIKELGAHEFINSTNPEDMKRLARERLDFMINTATMEDIAFYMDNLAPKGIFCQVGKN